MKTHKKLLLFSLFMIFVLASFTACRANSVEELSPEQMQFRQEQRRIELEHLARSTSIRVFDAIIDGNNTLATSFMTPDMQTEFINTQGFDAEQFLVDLFDTVGALGNNIPVVGGALAAVGGLGNLLVDGGQSLFRAGADLFNRVTGRTAEEPPRAVRSIGELDVYLVGERFAIVTGVAVTTGPDIDDIIQVFSDVLDNADNLELDVWQDVVAQLAHRFHTSPENLNIDLIRQALAEEEIWEFRLENIGDTWYVYALSRGGV